MGPDNNSAQTLGGETEPFKAVYSVQTLGWQCEPEPHGTLDKSMGPYNNSGQTFGKRCKPEPEP